jgi:serine/threonine-protein kinase
MGEVYRAKDTRLEREVAVKVLPDGRTADKERLRRFEQEARAAAALSHPNILALLDVGSHDGAPYLVYELLRGATLREQVKSGGLTARKAVELAVQVARGLTAAHARGVVHRDLKPENLFVTTDGQVKILDFGLAKLRGQLREDVPSTASTTTHEVTAAGKVLGTLTYMSPEQIRGLPVDERSDIFSFGAVLYEMLTGRPPFRRDTTAERLAAILSEDPPLPGPDSLSPVVTGIVKRCLEKRPEDRFHSAHDLALALEATTSSTDRPAVVKPRRVSLGWTAMGLGLLAAVGVWRGQCDKPRRPEARSGSIRSIAVLPLQNLPPDPEQEYFADAMTEALIAELGQIPGLRVISRTSMMRYKGTHESMPEIARELQSDTVVEGSILRSGDRVRITLGLIETATDRRVSGWSFERDLGDILALQRDVAHSIASGIKTELAPKAGAEQLPTLAYPGTAQPGHLVPRVNPEAYAAYARGLYFFNHGREASDEKEVEASLRKGVDFFEEAIHEDPAYAQGYVGLASTCHWLGSWGFREFYPRAKAAAVKALALDETLAEAHGALAFTLHRYDWDWLGAERHYKRAIELNPSTGHHGYGLYLSDVGRHDEAIAEMKAALVVEPFSYRAKVNQARVYRRARRYDQAIAIWRDLIAERPGDFYERANLGRAHVDAGNFEAGLAEIQRAVKDSGGTRETRAALAWAWARSGRQAEARRLLADLEKDGSFDPVYLACVQTALGDRDAAFGSLERAYRARSEGLGVVGLKGPEFEALRLDPRFGDLLRRIGVP